MGPNKRPGVLEWRNGCTSKAAGHRSASAHRHAWQARNKPSGAAFWRGLLAFSAWNQLGYLAETWHPPVSGVLALPGWLAYVVRALVVPAAFMAAAFLAPMAEPITAQIEAEARATLADVFKIAQAAPSHAQGCRALGT
ncbi:MAG TPA: hypothetical protein VGP82_17745 [Ktedonobacterales bacterium]|jgi:hypothetical protein|nr:hypothetical protein [Ktedonobacterales bacterium]